ncbi:MAG: glycosyltransferase [Gemmatimonadota bacterium]
MRIAVVNLTAGGLSGGYRKYLGELIPLLRMHPDVERVDVFVPAAAMKPEVMEAAGYRSWPPDDARRGFPSLRTQIAAAAPDVVFIPTSRWLDFGGIPTVVMIRNMEPLERPFAGNTLAEAARNIYRAHAARRASLRADRTIAVSQHVHDFILERWSLRPERVGMVYHGIESEGMEATRCPPRLAQSDMSRLLFTAGSLRPARGLEDVIAALATLRGDGYDFQLAIAGAADPTSRQYPPRMEALARQLGVDKAIVWLDRISVAEMAWCFDHSRAFVMTSRCEACPNTALEAMARGALCVSTDKAPMPEFFADAALYYPAEDAAGLAGRLRTVSTMETREALALREAARTRAAAFSWLTTAERTVAELAAAIRSRSAT